MNTKEQFARVLSLLKGSRCQMRIGSAERKKRCPQQATHFAKLDEGTYTELIAGCSDHIGMLLRRGSVFAPGSDHKAREATFLDFSFLESELETASFDTQPPPESGKQGASWKIEHTETQLLIECFYGEGTDYTDLAFRHECPHTTEVLVENCYDCPFGVENEGPEGHSADCLHPKPSKSMNMSPGEPAPKTCDLRNRPALVRLKT